MCGHSGDFSHPCSWFTFPVKSLRRLFRRKRRAESKRAVFARFRDSRGNTIDLLEGYRDSLAPDWRSMLRPPCDNPLPPSPAVVRNGLKARRDAVGKTLQFLALHSFRLSQHTEVLEIGAYDGAAAFALALHGAATVVATDMAAYYINQTIGGEVSDESVAAKNAHLSLMREACRLVAGDDAGRRVSFVEDDICESSIAADSADLLVSWEVLEHISEPDRAFRHMFRILRPGGVAFHEYNSFFCMGGGHSLCTLDFPWGHARLSSSDFERYLDQVRPAEKQLALSFYHRNLNRMTLADLRHHAANAGFEVMSVIPWIQKGHLQRLSDEAYADCRALYPTVEVTDLVSPSVWVVLRKP